MISRWIKSLPVAELPRLSGRQALVLLLLAAAAWTTATRPPAQAVPLVGLAAGTLALLRWPRLALYALPFAIPFGSLVPVPLGGANVTAADALLGLLILLWIVRGIAARRIVVPRLTLSWPFALFFGAALVSVTGALSLQASVKELVKWLELFLIYAYVASEADETSARWLLLSVMLAGAAEAALGLYQFVYRVGPEGFLLFGGANLRSYGTFEQPNPFGGYLALIVPVALGIVLGRVGARKRGRTVAGESAEGAGEGTGEPTSAQAGERTEIYTRDSKLAAAFRSSPVAHRLLHVTFTLAALLALGAGLAAIYTSYSRGAWLAAAAALAVALLVPSRRGAALFALGAAVLVGTAFMGELNLIPAIVAERFASVTDYFGVFDVRGVTVNDANFAIVERMAHWQAAWEMFLDHPWLGVGFGNYAAVYPVYALPGWDEALGHAHNYPLNVLAEGGLVTEVGYLVFWAAAFLMGWRTVRRASEAWKTIAAGLLGALVALTLHNLFDDLFVHSMQLQVGLTLGVLEAVSRFRVLNLESKIGH